MICEGDHGDQNTADCGNKLHSARVAGERTRLKPRKSIACTFAHDALHGFYFILFFAFVHIALVHLKPLRSISNNDGYTMVLMQDFNPGAICNLIYFFTLKYPICFYVDVYILI